MKKIMVLTSGGDAPGMNAAIRAVVRTAHESGLKVFGCQLGYQGLVEKNIFPLEPESVANCIQHGGTILKAGRFDAFRQESVRDYSRQFLAEQQIDGMVIIGGNGSFRGAALLSSEGGPAIIGVPGSIDNDIPGTEYTIGYDTACNTAMQAIDKVRDTASSHNRNFLVEVMGRSSGFLAVDVGIGGGAEFILTPEFPISMTALAEKIMRPRRAKQSSIIVVAEADQPGRSIGIAEQLSAITGLQYKVCILGHTQRGGSPTVWDRKAASQMGFMAVQALIAGESHKMIGINQNQFGILPLPDPSAGPRVIISKDLLSLNEVLCT